MCMKEPGSSGEETGPDSTFREPGARPSRFSSFSSAGSAPGDFTMSLRGRSSRLRFPRPCMLFLHHAMAGLLCRRAGLSLPAPPLSGSKRLAGKQVAVARGALALESGRLGLGLQLSLAT